MSRLPPLDTHAHINPTISRSDLERLPAVIFAMTRSLAEATSALARQDLRVQWGVGCHPGVAAAQEAFDGPTFARLLQQAAVVGELGLDGTSAVPMSNQREILRMALRELAGQPRIVSMHSVRAQGPLLDELEQNPAHGVILHWWLGSAAQTRRAVELGCYFSINASMVARSGALDAIPPERMLTETDHPYGDRKSPAPRLPGAVEAVEGAFGRRWCVGASEARVRVWQNLRSLLAATDSADLLSREIRTHLVALGVV